VTHTCWSRRQNPGRLLSVYRWAAKANKMFRG
jgi:hypothetical protein